MRHGQYPHLRCTAASGAGRSAGAPAGRWHCVPAGARPRGRRADGRGRRGGSGTGLRGRRAIRGQGRSGESRARTCLSGREAHR
ncbi:hypothetical protein E3O48_05530 [Cryobacterium sp. HLT2-28]|nr:hypothetical protein E3O48_05530 [Cryobacterium sp. HLT2-28]